MKENGEEFDFKVFARQAADALRSGKPLAGKDGVFTPMLKMIIESALEGELDDHLEDIRGMIVVFVQQIALKTSF